MLACTAKDEAGDTATADPGPGDSPAMDTALSNTGDTAPPPVPLGACEAPDDLGTQPLVSVGRHHAPSDPLGHRTTHLLEVEVDPERERAYLVGYGGFYVYDVSADAPSLLANLQNPSELHKLAWLGDDRVAASNRDAGFTVIDVGDPTDPTRIQNVTLDDAAGLHATSRGLAVVTHTGALVSYRDTGSLVEAGRLEGLGNPWTLEVVDDLAYVADNSQGLQVVDLSDPAKPVLLTTVATAGGAQDVIVDGDHAYVAVGSQGVEIFSLADPRAPSSTGTVTSGGPVVGVHAADGLLWATDQHRVAVYDLSDPAAPVQQGALDTDEWAMHPFAIGTRLWAAEWGWFGVYELDTSTPAPDAQLSHEQLAFTGGDATAELTLTNRGGAELQLVGGSTSDPRFALEASQVTLAPGESTTLGVAFTDDGAEVDATVCLATNDPDEALLEVALQSGSSSSIAIGQPAVDFLLEDTDGELHQLSEHYGQPILLAFFATW